ncbi:MAG: prolyl oligopeptidase family serine peptidase [Aestuariibacter sp.]
MKLPVFTKHTGLKIVLTKFLLVPGAFLVTACGATTASVPDGQARDYRAVTAMPPVIEKLTNKQQPADITLEKIMSDPDWLGRQPQSPYWSADGKTVFYERKRAGSALEDLWQIEPGNDQGNGKLVALANMHIGAQKNAVHSQDGKFAAWLYEGSIYLFELANAKLTQLTKGVASPRNLRFAKGNKLVFQSDSAIFSLDIQTRFMEKLFSWEFADVPAATQAPADYIAEEQIKLIEYIAKNRDKAEQKFKYDALLAEENDTLPARPFYFDAMHRLVEVSVAPTLDRAILVTTEQRDTRDDTDIMPNYIKENGRIAAESVRRRVADAEPVNHDVWYLDLNAHKQYELSFSVLEGYNEDVLADVKQENAAREGKDYDVNRLPRDIRLMNDWYWSQSAIQWHRDGGNVAIMLEAWDNKDRWIATVDWGRKSLEQQHRLHDDAWINYKFNSFGWFNNSDMLYLISEQSGYANLYVKPLDGKLQGLVTGSFEVDELTLSKDDNFIYYQANKPHPGIYEIYRVNTQSGAIEQLTELFGMSEYQLSPDEQKLLLTHSKLTRPPELYLSEIGKKAVVQLTQTVSDEFNAYDWVTPQIVPVSSSNAEQPIYSRVYTPAVIEPDKSYPAVIFNHGAGYLQNSHMGWSGYFREFMFHSFLVQQGYIVMDMDYRASMGYGRDWRTAIYRRMGTPEIEDLKDGVEWLVENVQVDRQRVGTYGGSYGGFMTFMALFTAPDLFQAGAALRPVSDWAHYNHGYTSNILNVPDVDPIAYERSSPIYFAEGLEKPLLINAPMVDDNVFFVDVVRLVQRLIELEKEDFETAIYPVEPHGFKEPSSWLDEYRRIYKLFEENVK